MKRFWKKMFWWDAPAKGAFFALTLLLVGAYVLGSAFLLARELGWIERTRLGVVNGSSWPFLALFAILFLYDGILTLHLYCRAETGRGRYFLQPGFWIWLTLLTTIALWARPHSSYVLPLGMAAYFSILLPLSACFGKDWFRAAASVAAWIVAILMLWNSAVYFLFSFGTFPGVIGDMIPDKFPSIPLSEWLGISGYGWTLVWFGIALSAFFGWYLMTGMLFAGMAGCRFRAMFTRPVLLLLGIALAVYLAFAGMALNEARNASQNIARLEERFGHPLTAAAFNELYYGQDRPDAEFWKRAEELESAEKSGDVFPPFSRMHEFLASPRLELSDAASREWRHIFERKEFGAARWEELFSGAIPPAPQEYRAGQMCFSSISNPDLIRKFDRIEMWRIRFALADGRIGDAVTAYRNMERVNQSLLREPNLIIGLCWLLGKNLQLHAVELLLESGLLTDEQLQEISAGLRKTEEEIAPMQKRLLYGEAFMELDLFYGLATGVAYDKRPLDLDAIGIFVPQYRWGNLREKSELTRLFDVADFSEIVSDSADMPTVCTWTFAAYRRSGTFFQKLDGRLQAMRALIAAELWKREHGEYPDTLPDTRTDIPLLYRKGESQIEVERFSDVYNPGVQDIQTEELTVPAVQVWSPAAGDDGPENRTRAIMRLPQSK